MSEKMDYSLVIPVYNSAATLSPLLDRIKAVFAAITDCYEIIFVDDGSRDSSWAVLEKLQLANTQVKIIQLMRNFGQHNALMAGFAASAGEYIITMDDDLQNPPEEIPKLIAAMQAGQDVVYGAYLQKKHSLFRNLGSRFIQFIYKKVFHVSHNLTAFRIIRRPIITAILPFNHNFVFIDGLLAAITQRISATAVVHDVRAVGKSHYSLSKLFSLAFNLITNFSIFPLKIASFLGILFSLCGFAVAFVMIVKKIVLGIPVSGYTSLIVSVTFFAGIQLLTIGLVGEYLGRVYMNVNDKPQYIVRQKKG